MSYEVTEGNGEFGVCESGGGMVYDLLETNQEAHDIALVLNDGYPVEWNAVQAALLRLVVVKKLRPA